MSEQLGLHLEIARMFRWLNKQGVESTEGYILQRAHRFYYHYIEGDKVLQIIVEPGFPLEEVAFPKNPTWNAPHENVPLDAQRLEQIKANMVKALTFMKISHQFCER